MSKNKPVIIRKFLYQYGKKMGYDASSFPNKILKMIAELKRNGEIIEDVVGVRKFGGRWFPVYQDRFESWLAKNVKPGPHYGLNAIPHDLPRATFLKRAKGLYNLRAVLAFLETEIVDFYKVRNAAKKIERNGGDPKEKLGAFIKNGIWVVAFPKFGAFLRDNEPKIWSYSQSIPVDPSAE